MKIVRSEVDRLYSTDPFTLVKLADRDAIRFEVEFQGDWPKSPGMGIMFAHRLNAPRDLGNGYAFIVRPAWPKGDPESPRLTGMPPSFDATGRAAVLEIRRDGVPLGLIPFQVRPGPARLTAERLGDRLMIQLNGLTSLTVEDPLPLVSGGDASVAVWWPPETSVRYVYAEGQALPATVSRLQQADRLFSQGKFEEAIAGYESFIGEKSDPELAAEVRYKIGIGRARFNRMAEATKFFEEASFGESRRWGVLAAFQAWHIRLEARQGSEAEAMMALIHKRYARDTITRFVPMSLRSKIEPHFVNPPINWLIFDPKRIAQQETALRLAEVLQLQSRTIDREVPRLVLALALAGEYRKAREVTDQYFDALMELGHMRGGAESPHWAARLHAWTGRLTGRTGSYQDQITKHLGAPLRVGEDPENRKRAFVPLRLENARNFAFQGDWKTAEAELDAYIAEYPTPVMNYAFYSDPRFMKGFARLKAGDPVGATNVWKEGTYAKYLESIPPESRSAEGIPPSRKALAEAWAMAALSETLSDEDATKFFKGLIKSFGAHEVANQVAGSLNISPSIMRGAWTSPRGKEWARKMAFLDLSADEYYWTPPRLLAYETICREAFSGTPTPAQDEIIWQTSVGACEAIRIGEISRAEVLQLALAWKGSTDRSGWGGLAPNLKPELRSTMAYMLGHRYRRLNKLAEATEAFKMAAADSPAQSSLRKLAEVELLKK